MKNLKRTIAFIVILGSVFMFNACNKVNPPEITMHELGYDNSRTVKRGTDLHIDAEILAEGKIQIVLVTVHPESPSGNNDWETEQSYTKFEGYKNTTFHEHIEVANNAAPGPYHFHLEVVDLEGNTGNYETNIEVTE